MSVPWAWEITKDRFVRERLASLARISPKMAKAQRPALIRAAEELHEMQVMMAASEGKPVPPEVLEDYPDVVKFKILTEE